MDEPKLLGQQLHYASHLFRKQADARLAKYDVTPTQARVITFIVRSGGQVTQQSLGTDLRVKPSTVNGIVDRMIERGLVTRGMDESDARRRHILLTQAGRRQAEQFRQEFLSLERLCETCFTQEELAQFQSFLSRMIHQLEEDCTKC